MDLFGIGAGELLMIFLVAFLVLGPRKVIDFGKSAGKMVRSVKKASTDLTSSLTHELEEEERSHTPPPIAEKKEPGNITTEDKPTSKS
jgi:sec-independent protein translocase protein TatA